MVFQNLWVIPCLKNWITMFLPFRENLNNEFLLEFNPGRMYYLWLIRKRKLYTQHVSHLVSSPSSRTKELPSECQESSPAFSEGLKASIPLISYRSPIFHSILKRGVRNDREIHQLSDGDYVWSEEMRLLQLRDGSTGGYVILYKLSYLKYFKIIFKVAGVKGVLGGENDLKQSPEGRKHRPCLGNSEQCTWGRAWGWGWGVYWGRNIEGRGRSGEQEAMRLYDAHYMDNDLSDVYFRKEVGLQHVWWNRDDELGAGCKGL